MKSVKYLSLLFLSLSLFSCGPTSSSSQGAPAFNETGVQTLLGSKDKLKTYLDSLNENVKSFKAVQYHSGEYGETTITNSIKMSQKDLLIEIEQESVFEDEVDNFKTTEYTALVDNTKYEIYYSDPSNEVDYAIKTEIEESELINEQIGLDLLINENGLSAYLNDKVYGWGALFQEGYVEKSYRATIVDDYVQVRTKTAGNAIEYLLVATFDNEFNFNEGTLTKNSYSYTNWDENLQQPKAGALPSSKTTYTLSNVELGREASNTPVLDFEQYFIKEIVGEVNIYSTYVDQTTFQETISEPNELFQGQYLDANSLFGLEGFSYLPETALDKNTITITSSSNENALYEDDGLWIAGTTVGEKTTVTIGNDSNPNMASVELTVVEIPTEAPVDDAFLPVYDSSCPIWDISKNDEILPAGKSIDMTVGQLKRFGLPALEPGPFDGLDEGTITYSTPGIADVVLSEINFSYSSGFSAWFIYIDVTSLSVGSTDVTFKFKNVEFVTITINVIS